MSKLRSYNVFVFVSPAAALQTKPHPNVKDLFDINLHVCVITKNTIAITICADMDELQNTHFTKSERIHGNSNCDRVLRMKEFDSQPASDSMANLGNHV